MINKEIELQRNMKDVDETPFLQPPPVLLDVLSAEQRGRSTISCAACLPAAPTDLIRVLCPPPILIATPLS